MMSKREKNSRKYCSKALTPITSIIEKYPNGIRNIDSVSEEARAWIQIKIQQFRECVRNVRFPVKPVWWEAMRITRNTTAHQKKDLSDETFSLIVSTLFDNLSRIDSDLKQIIKRHRQDSNDKRKYENLTSLSLGTELEKRRLVDALEDYANPITPEDVKIEFPKNEFAKLAKSAVEEIVNHGDVKEYVKSHEGFSDNIITDILEWLTKTNDRLALEDPFMDEAIFVEQQKKIPSDQIAQNLALHESQIEDAFYNLPSVRDIEKNSAEKSILDLEFYHKAFFSEIVDVQMARSRRGDIELVRWKSVNKLEILKRNFIADMEKNLVERKNKWVVAQIDAMRESFLEKLYAKIHNFMKLEQLVSPFIKNLGRLWDLSEGTFETSGFEILETFACLLGKDASLQELAAILGKQSRAQATLEKELRDTVIIKSHWQPQRAYRGEINGLRYSNDISSILPCELSLMKNPAANKLFQLKFAQKQLLSFDYQQQEEYKDERTDKEEISVEKNEPKGPIIICVDTSGSMQGTPENIAKTITFALSKIALEEERKCYLISFSTKIQTLELSDFSSNPIGKLAQFLSMSFNGGTDADPALEHALEMLSSNEWKNADVLMISDFVMQSLDAKLVKKIKAERKKSTCFYSLVIGKSGNKATIDCFNHNWLYDLNSPQAGRHLAEQLHEIKTHKNVENNVSA